MAIASRTPSGVCRASVVSSRRFSASLSDPNAPLGEPLPEGGGEPGLAYLKWVEIIHAGDVEALKTIVPAEIAEQIEASSAEEAKDQMDFMQATTPKDVKIVRGSSDGETAIDVNSPSGPEAGIAADCAPSPFTATKA